MGKPTAERETEIGPTELAPIVAAGVRRPGEKRSAGGRIAIVGLSVVLAGALAVGIGAIVFHKSKDPKTLNAANTHGAPKPIITSVPPSRVPTNAPTLRPGKGGLAPATDPKDGHKRSGAKTSTQGVRTAKASGTRSTLVSNASGRCIDVTHEGATGIPLQIWTCHPETAWQQWTPYSDGSVRSMGKCMTVTGSADGAPVELASCNGGQAQRFRLNGSQDLLNASVDKCVDVKDNSSANGASLQLWSCRGTGNQKWHTG
jgi:hypothetical protein